MARGGPGPGNGDDGKQPADSRAIAKADNPRIELVSLADLVRWPGNPKLHADAEIAASIRRFGFVEPIAIDEGTGRIVAGHGRLGALEAMRQSGEDAPRRVFADGAGDWRVPTLRGVTFDSEGEAEAYVLASNQTSALGGWDDRLLADALASVSATTLGFDGTGFDQAALDAICRRLMPVGDGHAKEIDVNAEANHHDKSLRIVIVCRDHEHAVAIAEVCQEHGWDYSETYV